MKKEIQITYEDLVVEELWLERIGVIEKDPEDEEDVYISRKAVLDILRESLSDLKDNTDYIELAFKIATLPIIHKPPKQAVLYSNGFLFTTMPRAG